MNEESKTIEEIRRYLKRSSETNDKQIYVSRDKDEIRREDGKDDGENDSEGSKPSRQRRKRTFKQSQQLLPKRRGRPASRMVQGRRNPVGRKLGNQRTVFNSTSVNNRKRNKRKINRTKVPVTQTVSFEKGIMFKEPVRTYYNNGDCVMLKGVEFVAQLKVHTTAAPVGSKGDSGDIIFVLPLTPVFLPGTDLYKEAQIWEKYRWRKLTMHYIPSCPSTTNGALVAWGETDIARPTFGILTDGPSRVREALARKGAKMFHPFKEIDIELDMPHTNRLDWYNTYIDQESEQSVPATFMAMLESAITDPNAQTTMNCGQMLLEYEIELCNKSMIDGPIPSPSVDWDHGATASNTFTTNSVGQGVVLKKATLGLTNTFVNMLYVIIFTEAVLDASTGLPLTVTCRYTDVAFSLGIRGSVYYGSVTSNDADVDLYVNIEDAILKNQTNRVTWVVGATATDTINWISNTSLYDLSDLL